MADLKLSEIWIYPIKSLGGIQVQQSKVLEKGLQHDRRWMLVDETGQFMTQRIHPQMALFKLSFEKAGLNIMFGNHTNHLSFTNPSTIDLMKVTVWDDSVLACEVSPAHSEWFSSLLGMKCKLVFFPEGNSRPVDPAYKINDEHVSLADAYPFLIIGQSTLDNLNEKLEEALPMNRFRPNLVFTGGEPHEEDTWRNFVIGANRFVGVKLCARCVLTTVNQDTAEKGVEPLKTLATYRKQGNKILFGQNLVALDHGHIHVGDQISVQ